MDCYYCSEAASGVCTQCAKAYCRAQGDGTRFCYRCKIDRATLRPAIGLGVAALFVASLVGGPIFVFLAEHVLPGFILCWPTVYAVAFVLIRNYRSRIRAQPIDKWESEHPINV